MRDLLLDKYSSLLSIDISALKLYKINLRVLRSVRYRER
jgi:hypothetical protein